MNNPKPPRPPETPESDEEILKTTRK